MEHPLQRWTKTRNRRPRGPDKLAWQDLARAGSPPESNGAQDGAYHKTTLENGIRVVTESMPGVRSVAIGLLVDASPRDEAPEKAGLAHLVEHVTFHGTSSRDAKDIAELMDAGGGSIGAFTTRDYTCYLATVLDDYRTYALDLLGDILLNSIYPMDRLEREKEIILSEIAATYDSPCEHANLLLKQSTWPCHPLGRPILGYPDTVKTLTREDVIYFVHRHYAPHRIIIAAAGNVAHQDFVAQVRDAFWRLQGSSEPGTCSMPAYQAGVRTEPAPISQAYFCVGMQAYPYGHPDRYTVHLLNDVLGGGISSRLFRQMREELGLVYDIRSEYHAYLEGGLLVIEGSTAPQFLNQVLSLSFRELEDLMVGDKPVSEEELWRAKKHLCGQHLLSSESTSTRMSRLATQEFYLGRHLPSQEILAQIDLVDNQTFNHQSGEFLSAALGQVMIAVVGPESPEQYCDSSIRELLARHQVGGAIRQEVASWHSILR